jgi:hypothetical protein
MIIRRSASTSPPASIGHDVIGGSPLALAYGYTRAGIDWYATEDELEALRATGEALRRQDQDVENLLV